MSYNFGVRTSGGSSSDGGLIKENPIATATNMVGKRRPAKNVNQSFLKCHTRFFNKAFTCLIGEGFKGASTSIRSPVSLAKSDLKITLN